MGCIHLTTCLTELDKRVRIKKQRLTRCVINNKGLAAGGKNTGGATLFSRSVAIGERGRGFGEEMSRLPLTRGAL